MAHELADGFVERSVAVKVRNNLATIEYSIGLNPKTRQQLIEFWASQSSLLPKQREPSDAQTQRLNAALRSPDFLELAGTNVSARLKVWVNQELVPLDFVSSLASSRHHVDLTVTVEFHLSLEHARDSAELTICDGNFSSVAPRNHRTISPIVGDGNGLTVVSKDMPVVKSQLVPAPFSGAFRYALKTSGTTVLNRSNVAFILVRSQRRLDAEISPEDRASAYKIQAEVVKID